MYRPYNPNPKHNAGSDCVVRAISYVEDQTWDDTYLDITTYGFMVKEMPSINSTWGGFLRSRGYNRYMIPNSCPDCYTVKDFCRDNPTGRYVLATGTHVVAVDNGDYYDSWDSGNEIPMYYWKKERL